MSIVHSMNANITYKSQRDIGNLKAMIFANFSYEAICAMNFKGLKFQSTENSAVLHISNLYKPKSSDHSEKDSVFLQTSSIYYGQEVTSLKILKSKSISQFGHLGVFEFTTQINSNTNRETIPIYLIFEDDLMTIESCFTTQLIDGEKTNEDIICEIETDKSTFEPFGRICI